jgi:hypothetical protein
VFGDVMRSRSRLGSTGSKSNLTERVSIQLTPLTTAEVRRLPKPHTGFEAFVEPLAQIVQRYSDELGAGIDAAAMRDDLAKYQALAEQLADANEQLALIENTRLQLSSGVWAQELLILSRVRSAGRTNASLRHAIRAFEDFLKLGPKKKATEPTTPPSTP